jgi:Ca2+-transporting ATPase
MANASVICTGKTGILTQNVMTVVVGSVGVHAKFVRRLDENLTRADEEEERSGPNSGDFAIELSNLNATLTPQLVQLFNASIAVNSTAFETVDPESGATVFTGSQMEAALLRFAKSLGWANYRDTRDAATIIQMIPFSSDRKAMGCVVRLPDGVYRLYIKGASEILARKCTRHVVVYRDGANDNSGGGGGIETTPIGELEVENISRTIISYASQTLHTIALCYRDFRRWPPDGVRRLDDGEVTSPFPR